MNNPKQKINSRGLFYEIYWLMVDTAYGIRNKLYQFNLTIYIK